MDLQIPLLVVWIVNYYGMDLVAGPTGPGNHTCQVNKMDTGCPVKNRLKDDNQQVIFLNR